MALIIEDSQETLKKRITIPKNYKEAFKAMKKIYEPYLDKDKGIEGRNVLKSYASDKTFNKKTPNANGKKENTSTVGVEDAKMRLHRQEKFSPNSIQYQLYGGQLAHDMLKRGVEQARAKGQVSPVKPPKPTAVEKPKVADVKTKQLNVPNGKITFNESVDNGYSIFYDYISEYGTDYILNEFIGSMDGHYNWGPLIQPTMYKKALDEFMKFGGLNAFPEKYVYQWFGIIMKNTAILRATTMLAGHDIYYDIESIVDFANNLLGEENVDYDYAYNNEGSLKVRLNEAQLRELIAGRTETMFKQPLEGNYEPSELQIKYGNDIELFNDEQSYLGEILVDDDGIWFVVDATDFLDYLGFFEWCSLPDESDAYSDYGLAPLEKIISEYKEGMEASKVLVLINKALDVVHYRGDLSSMFIEGGKNALSRISGLSEMKNKKVIIRENQIHLLLRKL